MFARAVSCALRMVQSAIGRLALSRSMRCRSTNRRVCPVLLSRMVRRDQADRGDEQGSDLPGLSGGAGRADDAGSHALISRQDIDICAENSIRLANAQGWLREQQGVKQ